MFIKLTVTVSPSWKLSRRSGTLAEDIRIVIECQEDGYLRYPLSFSLGAIVGEGDTYAAALKDTESIIRFLIKEYGKKRFFGDLEPRNAVLNASIAETSIAV